MQPFHDGAASQHHSASPSSGRNDAPSSSYISSLSHALNISTPTSSKRSERTANCGTVQSTPTNHSPAVPGSHQATPTRQRILRTPTRTGEPPRILSLSGHEVFRSPVTPVSPWIHTNAGLDAGTAQGRHIGVNPAPLGQSHDQEWLLSGPSSSRTPNIFETQKGVEVISSRSSRSARAIMESLESSLRPEPTRDLQVTTSAGFHVQHSVTTSDPFRSYREQPASDSHAAMYENAQASEAPTVRPALSSTSVASLSPVTFSSAFPLTLPDGSFVSAVFEQDTPSWSTHLLPNNDLTEHLQQRVERFDITRPFNFKMQTIEHDHQQIDSHHQLHTIQGVSLHHAPRQDAVAAGSESHLGPTPNQGRHASTIFLEPMARNAIDNGQTAMDGHAQTIPSGFDSQSDLASHARPEVDGAHEGPDAVSAGLGLDLRAAPPQQLEQVEVLSSNAEDSYIPSILVDEMGRWMLGSDGLHLARSDHSSVSTSDSRGERHGLYRKDATNASFGATTEGSFTSCSNSSTYGSSFNDVPSPISGPPSASAEKQFTTTPASSLGLGNSHHQNLRGGKANHWDLRSTVVTPEIAMHDFSEFGQSVSIEHMADERWRTWPRNRDSVILQDRASTPALPASPGPESQLSAEERPSFDSPSASASSTRSRLLAEPYNKNMRSGRPSSSASTSSRSSIGNAAALESQQSTSVTGPTRPRSYIATGSLRMSSATRSGSAGGNSESGQMSNERLSGTALVLRRARGLSHGGHPSATSSTAMTSTRSIDALLSSGSLKSMTNFRHNFALQKFSNDGLAQMALRPQSLLETSSQSESLRMHGNSPAKVKAKVGFNEVSVALDTLRMFLKQKEPGETAASEDAASLPTPTDKNELSSPDKPNRTLRRTTGFLPPRGAFSSVDEFGTLQSTASATSLSPPQTSSATHSQSLSLGGHLVGTKQASQTKDDRLAVVEDLSERVMKLKAETERQKERNAAASMPPPSARPASVMQQRMQSSMTRREMHEEYLRKRATRPS
ncbi:uncharacterized protein MEPE_01886 [Melanopsichium pennsylvanicum]|uniref:Uncharacterized protein n=2 Tax=Melanopsichium pennsylvanicum TaxID=63383 RepID=A0AAJ4XIK1_9BASI|nr:putative protein [Melanopsichium pennsylvanicum 4]SNX83180.1 uncharacterized protein MEPE_01886 [Melanopsichium pennsylvanicum]